MTTWLIVVIVVVVIVLLVLGIVLSRRSRVAGERKQAQAREHLREAQLRSVQADKEQALAEEQAARARRERAEVEERAAQAERDARERVEVAQEHRVRADELQAKAEKLAPGVTADHNAYGGTTATGDTVPRGPVAGETVDPAYDSTTSGGTVDPAYGDARRMDRTYPDEPGSGSTRR